MPSVTFSISSENWPEFKEAVIKAEPVDTDDMGNPCMTEDQWVKEIGKQFYRKTYKKGRKMLAAEEIVVDEDLVT